ncbi:MAG: cohesin domain-containing protein, partial [Bacteroidota bacterium]
VDADFIFPDPTYPFATTFPEVLSLNDLEEAVEANFVAIKIGDINNSVVSNELMSGDTRNADGAMLLEVKDQYLEAGQVYDIAFRSKAFTQMLGYQFTLGFEPAALEFLEVTPGNLANLDAANFGLSNAQEGSITMSWNDLQGATMVDGELLFTLRFTAKASGLLHDLLNINSQFTSAEAYRLDEGLMDVELSFDQQLNDLDVAFALHQNCPNPYREETTIAFTLPESAYAKLSVSDLSGRLLKTIEGEFAKGYHEIILQSSELGEAGVLYYRLDTDQHSATRKMILIR